MLKHKGTINTMGYKLIFVVGYLSKEGNHSAPHLENRAQQ